jgi:diguanylate cyclase (GGDEF)-like protein
MMVLPVWVTLAPIRKPLRPHLYLMNLAGNLTNGAVAAAVFFLLAGGMGPSNLQWPLAALIAYGVFWCVDYVVFTVPMVMAGYYPLGESFRDWARESRGILMGSVPVALLSGLALCAAPVWAMPLLLTPFLTALEFLRASDELVDAQTQAERDALTGLYNRRALETFGANLFGSGSTPVGVIMCDLDNFKRLNDTRGHDVGDEALRRAAHVIEASMRSEDRAFRFGGEEFLVLVPGKEVAFIEGIAERIRAAIENNLADLDVTVSVGAYLSADADTIESAISAADQLMYRSKTTGKNKVTAAARENFESHVSEAA